MIKNGAALGVRKRWAWGLKEIAILSREFKEASLSGHHLVCTRHARGTPNSPIKCLYLSIFYRGGNEGLKTLTNVPDMASKWKQQDLNLCS